jgi:hypothetical protein
VLNNGIESALVSLVWQQDAFALATGYDEVTGHYAGLVLPGPAAQFAPITDSTLLVAPEPATTQAAADAVTAGTAPPDATGLGPGAASPLRWAATGHGAPAGPPDTGSAPARPENTRFYGVYKLDPDRFGRDLTRLSQEILQQIAAVEGASLEITVEVHANRPEGFPEDKVRIIQENARTLRFEQYGFEDE